MAPPRILLNLALDLLLAAVALPVALALAGGGTPGGAGGTGAVWWTVAEALSLLTFAAVALPLRLPRQYWRYVGLPDLLPLLGAAVAAAALFWAAAWAVLPWRPANPAFPVLHAGVLAALLGGARLAGRARHAHRVGPEAAAPAQPVVLAGSGETADLFIRALAAQRGPGYRVTGILAPRARATGRRILGVPILGAAEEAGAVLDALRAEGRLPGLLVLADPAMAGDALEAVMDAADRHGVPVRRAPRVTALDAAVARPGEGAEARRLDLRPVSIEDLLDRPQVPLDREGMARLVQGRRVLVTGAGGTIGSELARQIATLGPASLTLLDHGEFALYEIDLELSERHPGVPRRAVLADVRDEVRVGRLVGEVRPELVFHAAALKHVPIVEAQPLEGLFTNAIGTRNVAEAAVAAGVALMVMVSTDKAVNPTNVMGASKRLAELCCQTMDLDQEAGGTHFVTVRFGNVLGSAGSVIPLFEKQLKAGGPLTVTHPDVERYFMTIPEACLLILHSAAHSLSDGWGRGQIFVLDMGKPVKIIDLARNVIKLSGLKPDVDIQIVFTGLRPGEKLYEELFATQERLEPTRVDGIFSAFPRTIEWAVLQGILDELKRLIELGDAPTALRLLKTTIPDFEPSREIRALIGGDADPSTEHPAIAELERLP